MKTICLLFWFTLVLYPMLNGQVDETQRLDTIQVDDIVVTGTMVKVHRNNIPLAVTVVNMQTGMTEDESALLPALKGRVPGLFVTERGITGFGVSAGAAGQISMRGIGGNPTTGVLILIDGHPQFQGIFGHPLADSYVASDADRVEVIRGPASILYGSNAMGGVINIITRKQLQDGIHGNARLMYGSFNTQKYMASSGYSRKGFRAFASVNHDRTDGHRPNSDFKITNGYIKLGYQLNSHLQAGTDFSIAGFQASDPGPDTTGASPGYNIDITRGYCALSLQNDYRKFSGTARYFYNFGEHNISDGFHSKDANYGINIFEAIKLFNGNSITLGLDHLSYGGTGENIKFDKSIVDTIMHETGIFGFIEQTLFDKLTLNAGLRWHHHEVSGDVWIPSGGLAYKAFINTTVRLNVSKGFRNPTIRELFLWNHNSELLPESIMNYEAGVSQTLFHKRLSFELAGFIITGDNLIIAGEMGKLYNTGEVHNRGIEFSLVYNPSNTVSCNATYTHISMKAPVYATPEDQFYISGQYRLKKLMFMASLHHISGLDTDASANINTSEHYTLLGSKISYLVIKQLSLFLSGENMLNQQYENNHYYTMPGATFFGGISVKI